MGIDGFRYGGRGLIAACLFCLPSLKEGTAADFSSYKSNDGTNIIQISGKIETGDAAQFGQIASSVTGPTAVVLSGNGGIVIEGLKIGEAVHERQFDTAVLNGNQCASSCGLIWLAGAKRYLGVQARVGFHAAYTMAGGEDKETGVGNALIGGYLTRLGLSYAAIIYVTSAPPDEMRWLQAAGDKESDISFTVIAEEPRQPSTPAQPTVTQNVPAARSQEERDALNIIQSYYGRWSNPGTDVEYLAGYYNATVNFYGKNTPRSKVMDIKREFAARWPIRRFTIRANTLFAQCSATCSVAGVVEWDANSVERNEHSVGSANFVVRIAPPGLIISENGSVLFGHKEPLQAVPQARASIPMPETAAAANPDIVAASSTPAYADGRRDRIAYEQWVASLADGSYRDGVIFWAGNRSVKPTPSCVAGPSPAYPVVTHIHKMLISGGSEISA